MSTASGARILILGGIRSGKSRLAEALVAEAGSVRHLVTSGRTGQDAGQAVRRPAHWIVDELGFDPARLYALLADAKPDEAVLVDDLGGWLAALPTGPTGEQVGPAGEQVGPAGPAGEEVEAAGPAGDEVERTGAEGGPAGGEAWRALAAAVRDCAAARLVLVSPEVGLSLAPSDERGRAHTERLGALNQAVAEVCDAVALVVAGQPSWLRGGDPRAAAPAGTPPAGPAVAGGGTTAAGTRAHRGPAGEAAGWPPAAAAGSALARPAPAPAGGSATHIRPGMALPMPDEAAGEAARERLQRLDVRGAGLGRLVPLVAFAAAAQGSAVPRPWRDVRVLLLHADHDGGCAAGDSPVESAGRVTGAERGEGPFALLAGLAGASVQVVHCGEAAQPIETGDALTGPAVEAALAYGWQLAESAVDAGADLLALAASGAGAEAAAVAVIAATTSGEPAALLGRVFTGQGRVDDNAWMARCAAVRDALHRVRTQPRQPRALLAALGGADLAVASGALLGSVSRHTPVLVDGPVAVAAALLARDVGAQVRHWLVLPDDGGHPAVRAAAEVLGVTPLLDLRLGLGEGTAALAALPLLRTALALAADTPLRAEPDADGSPPAAG